MRAFITEGPGNEARHFLWPAAPRLAEVRTLVDQGAYFVFRAPGRTGKTTALRAIAEQITSEGRFACLVCSAAVAAPAQADVVLVQDALLSALRIAADQDLPAPLRPPHFPISAETTRLWEALAHWAQVCPLPLVLFFDDLDTLQNAALESVLQQFGTGFSRRPGYFPWSIGIATQFDLRTRGSSTDRLSTGPFESHWASRLLPPLTIDEIRAFYTEHWASREQTMTPEAIAFVHDASAGHPFLVQAFGREINEMAISSKSISKSQVVTAFRRLVEREVTPIDNLSTLLAQSRVRRVIEPLLLGSATIASADEAQVQFVRDIGLVTDDHPLHIEGALHRALVPRLLSRSIQRAVVDDPAACFDAEGRLDMSRLLQTFIAFYAEHASELIKATEYSKIAHELVFLGYLFRMLDGRGWVDVEFGALRGRIEVTLTLERNANRADEGMNDHAIDQQEVLVLLSRRKGDSGMKKRGLEWLDAALTDTTIASGTLVIFDKRDKHDKRVHAKRIKLQEALTIQGKTARLLRA